MEQLLQPAAVHISLETLILRLSETLVTTYQLTSYHIQI
jgi:hypothetical protein